MDNSIIEKIAKLLARADAAQNDNPHEREIAMRHANALLAKHGISMKDATDKVERKNTLGGLGRQKRTLTTRYEFEVGVWLAIANMNGCDVIKEPGYGLKKIWLIGRQMNCTVTIQIASYVIESIKREATKQGYKLRPFGQGAWYGVADQVERIIADKEKGKLDDEPVSESTALVVASQFKQLTVETKNALEEFFPRVYNSGYGYNGPQRDGQQAGREYGSKVGLNTQLGNGAETRRLSN